MTSVEPRVPEAVQDGDVRPTGDEGGGPGGWRRRQWYIVALVGLAVVLAAAVLALSNRDRSTPPAASTTTTTASSSTTGSSVPPASAGDHSSAVWPTTAVSPFTDPVAAARSFATDFAGFSTPVLSAFRAGDSRSGEVDVRKKAGAPASTILVRQLDATNSWWVIGAVTNSIQISAPTGLATITSPVRLRGMSTAFEATVQAAVREDGNATPLGRGHFNGGANGDMGPFDTTLAFTTPSAPAGAVVLFTDSMEDGGVMEIAVVRVKFGQTSANPTGVACGTYTPTQPTPGAGQMVVTVWFSCSDPSGPTVASRRVVPSTSSVLRASLDQLLAGPTAEERSAGLTSWFSGATAGMVRGVTIDATGRATVDFKDLRPVIPNASTSAGSQMLLTQLDATVFQFPSVHSAVYRIEGSCEAFTEWLQFGGCEPRTR